MNVIRCSGESAQFPAAMQWTAFLFHLRCRCKYEHAACKLSLGQMIDLKRNGILPAKSHKYLLITGSFYVQYILACLYRMSQTFNQSLAVFIQGSPR